MRMFRNIMVVASMICLPAIAASGRDAASGDSLWTVNTIKAKLGMLQQGAHYLEAKWLLSRVVLLKQGDIASFKMLVSKTESNTEAEFVLITQYPDAERYRRREENFQTAFRAIRAPDEIVIDGLKRADIFGPAQGLEDYTEHASGPREP